MSKQLKCGFLILDRKGEYVRDSKDQRDNPVFGLQNHPKASERMIVVSENMEFAEWKEKKLIFDHLMPQFNIKDIDPVDLLDFLPDFTPPQASIIRDYSDIDNFYEKLLAETQFGIADKSKWINHFENLYDFDKNGKKLLKEFETGAGKTDRTELLDSELEQLQGHTTGTKADLLERGAKRIKRFCLHRFFGKSTRGRYILSAPSCVDKILQYLAEGKFVFIDMLGQSNDNYTLVAALFARKLLTKNKELEKANKDQIRACIIMEEAQNILNEDALAKGNGQGSVFVELAREGRSLKLGFVLVTQQPDVNSIAQEVVKTIDTVVAFNMPPDDAKHLHRLKSGFSGLELEISNAAEFRGVAISSGGPVFFQSGPVDAEYMKLCSDGSLKLKYISSTSEEQTQPEKSEPASPIYTIEDRLAILKRQRQEFIQEIALASMQQWRGKNWLQSFEEEAAT